MFHHHRGKVSTQSVSEGRLQWTEDPPFRFIYVGSAPAKGESCRPHPGASLVSGRPRYPSATSETRVSSRTLPLRFQNTKGPCSPLRRPPETDTDFRSTEGRDGRSHSGVGRTWWRQEKSISPDSISRPVDEGVTGGRRTKSSPRLKWW